MTAKEEWKEIDRKRRLELQEERLFRAFCAPSALLPRAIAGQRTGVTGDFSMPRRCGEGDPANFSEPEKALIARMLTVDRSKATHPELQTIEHFRRVGHPAFQ